MVVVCYRCDVMWVKGCPALTPVNTSSEKKRDIAAWGMNEWGIYLKLCTTKVLYNHIGVSPQPPSVLPGKVIFIKDYEGT